MGLPYWTVPAPIDVKEATKADVTAAQRSPIRRRHSPARLHRSNARRASGIRDEIISASGRPTPPGPGNTWRVPPRRTEEYSSRTRNPGLWSTQPPLPISSWDYSQASRDLSRPPSYYAASGFERDHSGFIYPRELPRERRGQRDAPEDAPRHRALRPLNVDGQSHSAPVEQDLRQLPPLRRMGRRNIADGPLPASSLRESWEASSAGSVPNPTNGLGDRERSPSPPAEDTTDAWDTMLTTITPDEQLPSFDSSFTSAAASASASFSVGRSNNNSQSRSGSDTRSSSASAVSSRTHITVPSPVLASVHTAELECTTDNEHSLDSGSDTEDDNDFITNNGRTSRAHRALSPPTRRALPTSTAELSEILRTRSWRTSAIREEPTYQAEAELRLLAARRETRERASRRQQDLDGDIVRLQEHSRELDRQMVELQTISADIDRRHLEREQRDRDRESERRLGLPPMSPQRRGETSTTTAPPTADVERDASRFVSHYESFRQARDAAHRDLREITLRRAETEQLLAEALPAAARAAETTADERYDGEEIDGYRLDGQELDLHRPETADGAEMSGLVRNDPTLSRDEMLGNDPELEGMRSILQRMSRREDIPDWWWRSAGLSTAMPRGRL